MVRLPDSVHAALTAIEASGRLVTDVDFSKELQFMLYTAVDIVGEPAALNGVLVQHPCPSIAAAALQSPLPRQSAA